MDFNPRSPRGLRQQVSFQEAENAIDFNPRSPRGLRQNAIKRTPRRLDISIHAAQEGCDLLPNKKAPTIKVFQSTQPKRAATAKFKPLARRRSISIHAAQEGCDTGTFTSKSLNMSISIHAAQEGCDKSLRLMLKVAFKFQSTQPKRAAT